MKIELEDWRPFSKGALRGFAKVLIDDQLVLSEVCVFASDGKLWALPPARAQVDRDGRPMKDALGKWLWQPIVSFPSKAARDAFSLGVVEAVLAQYPGALAEVALPDFPKEPQLFG